MRIATIIDILQLSLRQQQFIQTKSNYEIIQNTNRDFEKKRATLWRQTSNASLSIFYLLHWIIGLFNRFHEIWIFI